MYLLASLIALCHALPATGLLSRGLLQLGGHRSEDGSQFILQATVSADRYSLMVAGVVFTVVVVSAVVVWATGRPRNTDEDTTDVESERASKIADPSSARTDTSARGKEAEPASSQACDNPGAAPSKELEPVSVQAADDPGALEDYEDLVRKIFQKGAQEFGPKFSKGSEIHNLLQTKMTTFADKVKALVTNELNDTAGSIAKVLEMEEFMLLLDWDAAVAANFPPLSVLFAGLLVPVNLAISKVSHLLQSLVVMLPVLVLCAWAEYADWDHPCGSIPGLRVWARLTGVLALTITVGRLALLVRISAAQADLQKKSEEMSARLSKAEAKANSGEAGISDLKELLVCHVTTLQYAVVCESRTRTSIFSHMVGVGTLLWLLTTVFNGYLYFKYMFVPGVVAFHPSAAADPSYCAAWVTVCSAKVALLLAVLFFFVNVLTVLCWATETTLNTESVANKIAASAKDFDSAMMGIPVTQLLVKSFLLRGSTDVLCAQFAVAMREKSALAQDYAATERRLVALKAQIEAKESQTARMKEEMINVGGGTMEALAQRLSSTGVDLAVMKDKGASIVEEARERAKQVEQATTEEIERLVEKLQELMNQVTESDSFKQAQAAADEAAEKAKAAAEQAQAAAEQAMEQAKETAGKAMETLQDPETMEKAKAAMGQMAEQAQAAAGQAMETLQDPEMMEKAKASLQQAQSAAGQAMEAIQDPEMMEKAKAGLEQAQAAATEKAKAAVEQAQAAAEQAQETAKAGIEQAQAAAEGTTERAKAAAEQAQAAAQAAAGQATEQAKAAVEQAQAAAEQAGETAKAGVEQAQAAAGKTGKKAKAAMKQAQKKAAQAAGGSPKSASGSASPSKGEPEEY